MASTVTSTNNLSLRSILEKDKLTGSNFLDWERNLMIVLRHERKWYVLEEPLGEAPPATAPAAARNAHKKHSDDLLDVACLMLATMSPDLQAGLINTNAYDMIRQLRDMFQTKARTERYVATKAFNECKMVKGTSVSDHVMKMKRHLDHLERLGHPVPLQLATDTILNSLSEDYRPFVVNYNMNNMEKSIAELHSMLKTAELNMGNKNKTKDVLMVRDGGVKKKNGHASTSKGKGPVQAVQSAPKKGKGKGKGKKVKPNKARTENRCFTCNEVGHWRENCPKRHEAGSYDQLLNNSYKCCRLKVAQIFDRVANIGRDPQLRLLLGIILLEEQFVGRLRVDQFSSNPDMEDYDGIPDDDVPMWVLRKRQHESTLKELLEKPMANRSSLQQKVNRPYVKSEDFNSSLILQDETMDEQSDDRPSWGLKEQDWEDRIRDVGSLADSLRKMREESERMRESMKKSEWLTHSTIQPQVSCPSFKVNNDSNEKFLLGQDSYSKMKVEGTWFGKGVELSLQKDARPNDKIEEPPTRMINSMDQPVIEKLAPPIEDSWIQHEVIPPWSDSDDSDDEFSWQVNTAEEYQDEDCLDGIGILMQDDQVEESTPEEASSDQTLLSKRPDSRNSNVHSARRQGENRNSKWYATLPGGSHKGKSVSPGRNNQFTAFPKRRGPSREGLGHAPPSFSKEKGKEKKEIKFLFVRAYRHITGQRSFFFDYVERFEGYIKTAEKNPKPMLGYGKITDRRYIIKDVRYVEGLGYNMFSSSQFCDNGYWVKQFLYGSSVNDEDGNVVLSARRNDNLYSTASKEDSWLWHRRLCHQNFKDMNKLVSKRLVSGLPETRLSKDTLCPACEQGKMKRSSHPPKMDTNSKSPLDLCGPMRVESLARRNTCYRKVKKLRSDNGTEFRNAKLQSFLEDVGISHNFSAAEAVSTACFTQNRTLIVKWTGKTAYEMIEQRKPNIDYFRVFGCKCYVLNDREGLGKFDPKSNESIFIGYSLNSKTYRVFKKRTRIILESSNVDFSETETYSDACPSNPNALLLELSTAPPSTDFASNSFASDFIDPANYDLPTLTGPIVVPAHPGSSTTSVSSDAFMTEPSSSTSTDSVTPESVVSPPENSSTEPPTVASAEPVREQTTSPVLSPIPEEAPLPSPSSSQRTYAQVFREPRLDREPHLEVVLNIEPLTNLQEGSSSGNQSGVLAVHDENDASNNQQAYVTLPHFRKWTRSHLSSQIIGIWVFHGGVFPTVNPRSNLNQRITSDIRYSIEYPCSFWSTSLVAVIQQSDHNYQKTHDDFEALSGSHLDKLSQIDFE
ncbi:hypothetical protein OSB04_006307 [Centaurea solstitialis]|uniref:CCHC-type domain-containing protein n=1 Tax=Centaurea solstitialis TaxID=347529 RepID=A0AA38U0U1_9ASTR|nr:hypothetical protein OSB04_006307 [Centaurea solstitialis]